VTKIYEFEGEMVAQTLTLETGAVWPEERFECWQKSFDDVEPFYRFLVG